MTILSLTLAAGLSGFFYILYLRSKLRREYRRTEEVRKRLQVNVREIKRIQAEYDSALAILAKREAGHKLAEEDARELVRQLDNATNHPTAKKWLSDNLPDDLSRLLSQPAKRSPFENDPTAWRSSQTVQGGEKTSND